MINRLAEELLVAAGRRPPQIVPTNQENDEGLADQLKHWAREAETLIASHPGASLAAALGCGILIGWWVKRT